LSKFRPKLIHKYGLQIKKKDIDAADAIRRKFFGVDHETSIPAYNEQNLRLLEQIFSTSVFQAPLCRDLDLMVIPLLRSIAPNYVIKHMFLFCQYLSFHFNTNNA
jgi:hypothetical protein